MTERPKSWRMPAQEWIRIRDEKGEEGLIPGNRNLTAELLAKINKQPYALPRRGRPPKPRDTSKST